MFDKRWTSQDAELSIHAEDDGAAVRLFTTVLVVSLTWTLIGLALYGAAVFDAGDVYHCDASENNTILYRNDGTAMGACGAWMWRYSLFRACVVTMAVGALCWWFNQATDWRAACIALPVLLVPFALVTINFLASDMQCCAGAVYDAAPALCVACGIFVCIDALVLLGGAVYAAAAAMTTIAKII